MRQHICKAVPNWAAFSFPNEDNITSVTRNGIKTTCVYDSLGQLIRVNNPSDTTSGSDGTTWVYDYDRGGNILNKKRYAYTTGTVGDVLQTIEYTYGDTNWKDKMTAYNGTAITYDAIGNPVTYGNWTYTWEKGRQLKKMEHTNGTIVEYAYNSEGLRVSKTVTNTAGTVTTTQYTLHGSNLVHLVKGSKYMHFWYDAQNRPTIVNYNGTRYAYIVNLQGDVLGLIDSNGDEVVRYTYDAWGKVLSTTGTMASSLGALNPFRYRGYVYDTETNICYLRSRYYNSIWGRFINADRQSKRNMFAYCSNSPVLYSDHNGMSEEEEDVSIYDIILPSYNPTPVPIVFNQTISSEMQNLLQDKDKYYYISKSKDNKGGLDCVWAINIADGIDYGRKVDTIFETWCIKKDYTWGIINSFSDLKPGDLIFSVREAKGKNRNEFIEKLSLLTRQQIYRLSKNHIGKVVLFDFGYGEELAVFQSCSEKLDPQNWRALFYGDMGPNITALEDNNHNSNWYLYIRKR